MTDNKDTNMSVKENTLNSNNINMSNSLNTFQIQNSNRSTTTNNLLMNNNAATTASKGSTQLNSTPSNNINNNLKSINKKSNGTNSNYQSHHLHQYQKHQNYEDSMKFKQTLMKEVVELVKENDHNALAYLARTSGIPPQLRHLVWPILLKYHPFVICPNIMTNTLHFNIKHEQLKDENKKSTTGSSPSLSPKDSGKETITDNKMEKTDIEQDKDSKKTQTHHINWDYQPENREQEDLIHSIKKDISKYIMVKHEDTVLVKEIIDCVMKFLNKWGKIFKYESGLTWVCLSLMEWCSPFPYEEETETLNVLPGRSFYRSTHLHTSNKHETDTISNTGTDFSTTTNTNERVLKKISRNLFLEYPLIDNISEVYANKNTNLLTERTTFQELFEKTLLVFLHAPDLKTIIGNQESKLSQDYSPVISGGDFNFNQNLFYKMFEDCFPDLYQPFIDQLSGVINTSQNSWMYYWLKFASVRTFHKSDRARFWDLMFGWRANPMNLDFFLKYKNDNLKINHFYKNEMPERWLIPQQIGDLSLKQQIEKYCNQNEDYFWFPDLNQMKLNKATLDFYIFEELLKRNKQNEGSSSGSATPKSPGEHNNTINFNNNENTNNNDKNNSNGSEENMTDENNETNDGKKIENLTSNFQVYNQTKKSNNVFPYSLIDIHTQQIFIYLTILHKNEFKLLEYEEREVLEFLNNVPKLSKYDDLMYKNLASYTFDNNNDYRYDISDRDSIYSVNSDNELPNMIANNNRLETFNSNGNYGGNFLSPVSSNHSNIISLSCPDSPQSEKNNLKNNFKTVSVGSALSSDVAEDLQLNNLSLTYNNLSTQYANTNKLMNTRIFPPPPPLKPLSSLRMLQSQDTISQNNSRPSSLGAKNINNNMEKSDVNSVSNKKIEFGTDDKTLHSFNEVLNGGGDIWRKWAYQELEQNNN